MPKIISVSDVVIKQAAGVLSSGGLVAMPTETVYGLAANALDGAAVARIYEAKGRPAFNPLITHIDSLEQAEGLAVFNEMARMVARKFWPGPLTLILSRRDDCAVCELATAGLDTIALRMPDHPAALGLIKACGFPLVAPSANKSGGLSPTAPAHVAASLGDQVDMILAAGRCRVGLESTVLDLSGDEPMILRPGAVTAEDLESALGMPPLPNPPPAGGREERSEGGGGIKSPGQLLKHYAPNTPVRLNAVDVKPGEALLAFGSIKFMGIEGGGSAADLPDGALRNLSEEGDLHEAAANLFACLKELDRPEHSAIAVMNIPDQGLGIAINDRLSRAAAWGNMTS